MSPAVAAQTELMMSATGLPTSYGLELMIIDMDCVSEVHVADH